jgi:hypothetical protein
MSLRTARLPIECWSDSKLPAMPESVSCFELETGGVVEVGALREEPVSDFCCLSGRAIGLPYCYRIWINEA